MGRSERDCLHSVTAAYHFWKYFDEIELAVIRENDGKLSRPSVRSIVRNFSVSRTLPSSESQDFQNLADEINALAKKTEGDGLREVASACMGLATKLNERRRPFSAVSKLLWFVRPSGWTMYDSFAAKGLKAVGENQFIEFYDRLDSAGFADLISALRVTLDALSLPLLLAERIVDWELMRRGGQRGFHDQMMWTTLALKSFEAPVAANLEKFAREAEAHLAGFAREKV